jgi:hypothetical protein
MDQNRGRILGGYVHSVFYEQGKFEGYVNLLLRGMGQMLTGDPEYLWQENRLSRVSAALTGMNNVESGIRKLFLRTHGIRLSALGITQVISDIEGPSVGNRAIRFDIGRGLFYIHASGEDEVVGTADFAHFVSIAHGFPAIEDMLGTVALDLNAA